MNKRKILFLTLFACVITTVMAQKAPKAELCSTVTNNGAWCWFSDPRAVSFKGQRDRTYVGWVSSTGDIVIAAVDNQSGKAEQHIMREAFQKDDHACPSILTRPDGRVLVFYSPHGGKMYLVRSKSPEDISAWENEEELKEFGNKVCYSNPVQLSAEQNRIYIFWRRSDWQPGFSWSDDGGKSWIEPKILIRTSKPGNIQRPYVKISSDGIKRIDIAFTDGHPEVEPENSIYHIYYEGGSIYQTNGEKICFLNELPLTTGQVNKVYDASLTKARAWVWDIATGKKNKPVIVYTTMPDSTDHHYQYARWTGNRWINTEITPAGKWFPQTPENKKETESYYSGGIVIDHNNPSVVYLSKPENSVFEIEMQQLSGDAKKWIKTPVTQNSEKSNVRPVVVRNYSATGPRLFWMNLSGYYIHYTNFSTSLKYISGK
jgi:hypothetical protein